MPPSISKDEFILRSQKKHGSTYDYTLVDYKNLSEKVQIICSRHGIFWESPMNHFCGGMCPLCKKEYNKNNFINRALELYNDKYDYSMVEYITAKTKVEIGCKEHGYFKITPDNFLNGQKCRKCSSYPGRYDYKNIEDNIINSLTKDCFIYLLKMQKDDEVFYKIGISVNGAGSRCHGIVYKKQIIENIKTNLYTAFNLEQFILSNNDRYYPKLKFPGHTECLKNLIDVDEQLKLYLDKVFN